MQQKLICENVSRFDVMQGNHISVQCSSTYLIQISDTGSLQTDVKYEDFFKDKLCLNFNDVEDEFDISSITDYQAQQIADFILKAKTDNADIVVHCLAGICRSGAVVEAAMSVGYTDAVNRQRIPNALVKRKVMQCLGTYITPKTSMFSEDFVWS